MTELQKAYILLESTPIKTTWLNEFPNQSPLSEAPPSPRTPITTGIYAIPSHLVDVPALTDAALAAIDSGITAATHATSTFESVLQHGLNLQELASRLGADSPSDQLTLLHNACEVYKVANDVQQGRRTAVVLFNWAVALSDIARLVKPHNPIEAAQYLSSSALKYASAVAVDPNNPQALNNWALTLQELAALAPQHERDSLLKPAVARFRRAIRLQPDANLSSRFSYNLGTVLYSHACNLADNLAISNSSNPSYVNMKNNTTTSTTTTSITVITTFEERRVRAAFAHAASYIMLAYALKEGVKVYEDSVFAVQRLLPLPYLKTGLLLVAAPGTAATPEENWIPAYFALDAFVMHCIRPPASEASRIMKGVVPNIAIDVVDVVACHVCRDPSLPAGWAIWVSLRNHPEGMYLIAEQREDAEGWVDALMLLAAVGKVENGSERLQTALMTRRQRPQQGASQPR